MRWSSQSGPSRNTSTRSSRSSGSRGSRTSTGVSRQSSCTWESRTADKRDSAGHTRAAAGLRIQAQGAALGADAIAHVRHASALEREAWLEAGAVVADLEEQCAVLAPDPDVDR